MPEPGLALRFLVTIDSEATSATGPSARACPVEWEVHEYREGGLNDYRPPPARPHQVQNIKLTRTLDPASRPQVAAWISKVEGAGRRAHGRRSGPGYGGHHRRELGHRGRVPDAVDRAQPRRQRPRRRQRDARARPQRLHGGLSDGGPDRRGCPRRRCGSWQARPAATELKFLFNPTEYTVTKGATWNRPQTTGAKSATKPQFGGTNPQTVQMEIFFDAFEKAHDRRRRRRHAPRVDQAHGGVGAAEEARATHPDPRLGRNKALADFRGYLKTVTAKYTLFDDLGQPVACHRQRHPRGGPHGPQGHEPDVRQSRGPPPARPDRGRLARSRSRSRSTATRRCGGRSPRSTTSMTRCACASAATCSCPRSPKRPGWPDDARRRPLPPGAS